jgi:hypothetical protein
VIHAGLNRKSFPVLKGTRPRPQNNPITQSTATEDSEDSEEEKGDFSYSRVATE